jgi:hypothetical protein
MAKTRYEMWVEFAAAALSGVAANPESGCNAPRDLAHWAASVADAMLVQVQQRADELRKS